MKNQEVCMKSRPIVAIGGGSVGRSGPPTTTEIDRQILRLTGKKHPHVLFVPTAHRDPEDYVAAFRTQYEGLGCRVEVLYLYQKRPSNRHIERLISSSDLIYVGGGNPLRMMKRWRALGVDRHLFRAHQRGAVLAGMSAGAIGWFDQGLSDCWRLDHDPTQSILVQGLGLLSGICNPHYHKEAWRISRIREIMARRRGFCLGIDDEAALMVNGETFRVFSVFPQKFWVYRVSWQDGLFIEKRLPPTGTLAELQVN